MAKRIPPYISKARARWRIFGQCLVSTLLAAMLLGCFSQILILDDVSHPLLVAAIYTVFALILILVAFLAYRGEKRRIQMQRELRRGLCKCDYNLRGLADENGVVICPECGERSTHDSPDTPTT